MILTLNLMWTDSFGCGGELAGDPECLLSSTSALLLSFFPSKNSRYKFILRIMDHNLGF
jgi:hypothetical protein